MSSRAKTGYLLTDADLRVTYHSHIFTDWFGLGMAELHGRPLTEFMPELIGREEELVDGRPSHFPLCVGKTQRTLANGRERYFDLQVDALPTTPTTWLITLTDVTREAEQSQRLHQRRNELHLLSNKLATANEQLTFLLKRFVPARVADKLIESPELPKLGGHQRTVATIVFADMRNFTGMAEKLEPEETFDILNVYLEVLAQAVWENQGTIIQIVGDMIMATFNVPDEQADHALRGARTAVAMQRHLADFVRANGREFPAVQFGIGVHTGAVVTGYLGVRDRYRYSVVSDTTNVAFHLCARAQGGQIIISQPTLHALGGLAQATYLGDVTLKARKQPLSIYDLQAVRVGQ